MLVSLSSCINKSLISTTESEIADYAKCNNYESFHKWYYKAGYTIIDDGVTWGFYKAMPYTDNDDLRNCLESDLYGRPYAKAILFRIENNAFNLDGTVEKTFRGVISIEHVMPQTLGDDWKDQAISEEDHKQWRHKLGNLTLLSGAKNSAASNKAFQVKKTDVYAKRQSKSAFDMVSEVCKNDTWNIPQIKERQKKYVDWLCATLVV